jgi:phosphotransferase system HPr-like phosphotransfer protein
MRILIETIAKVKDFNRTAESCLGDITLKSGRYVINGKSFMGILSLDLTHPIELEVEREDERIKFEAFRV